MLTGLVALCLFIQDPLPATDAGTAAKPSAVEILDLAIAAQHGEKIGDKIDDFEVALTLERNDEQAKVALDVKRKFKAPDRIWTEVNEAVTGSRYVEATNGSVSWHSNAKDGVIVYDGPDYRTDVQRVEEDLRAMQLLMRFILLEHLKSSLTGLERNVAEEEKALVTHPDVPPSYVIEGRGTLSESEIGAATVRLWIDQKTHHLMGARLERDSAKDHPMQFCFWGHRLNRQGVAIPSTVTLYERDAKLPSQKIIIQGEEVDGEVVNAMTFNGGIDDALFAPPTK